MIHYGNAFYKIINTKRNRILEKAREIKNTEERIEKIIEIRSMCFDDLESLYFNMFGTHKVKYSANW